MISAADGVLANDVDVDGQSLSAVLIANVSQGALTFNGNGSFTYTPDLDFAGTDTFTYRATDGTLFSPIRTVTFTVEPAALRVQINEVMYHPSSESDAEEFIELVNTGTASVDLARLAVHSRRFLYDPERTAGGPRRGADARRRGRRRGVRGEVSGRDERCRRLDGPIEQSGRGNRAL